eukprot:s1865_g12.t1
MEAEIDALRREREEKIRQIAEKRKQLVIDAGWIGDNALDLALSQRAEDGFLVRASFDDERRHQGVALLGQKDRGTFFRGSLKGERLVATDGHYEQGAPHDLVGDGNFDHVGSVVSGQCPEEVGRRGPGLLVHFRERHMMWFLLLSVSVYTQAVALRAMEIWVEALKPIVPEPLIPPVAPGGQSWGNDTGLDIAMGALKVDPNSFKRIEPLREKALAEGSTVKTPRGSVLPPFGKMAVEHRKAMRAMEMEKGRQREEIPPAVPGGQRRGEGLGLAEELEALEAGWCSTQKGYPLRGMALAEGSTPNPPRGVKKKNNSFKRIEPLREKALAEGSTDKTPRGSVMLPLGKMAVEHRRAMRAMEMEKGRQREEIPPAVPDGQRRGEGLGLAEELEALEAGWCPTKKGHPLRGMALAEGSTPNPPRGVVGMVLEEEAAERGIALKDMELARKRWNTRGAVIGEAAVGRGAQAGLVLVERLVAAVRYRSVTHLWVLLSLTIMPGSDDGTRGARQRSLLPSPLWMDSHLALLDLLNTGKSRPPAGDDLKVAFGALGASRAEPSSLVMLRVLVKDPIRDQSETTGEVPSSPIFGYCRSLFSGVRILYQAGRLVTSSQLDFYPAKPEGPASVVVACVGGWSNQRRAEGPAG